MYRLSCLVAKCLINIQHASDGLLEHSLWSMCVGVKLCCACVCTCMCVRACLQEIESSNSLPVGCWELSAALSQDDPVCLCSLANNSVCMFTLVCGWGRKIDRPFSPSCVISPINSTLIHTSRFTLKPSPTTHPSQWLMSMCIIYMFVFRLISFLLAYFWQFSPCCHVSEGVNITTSV